MTAAREIEHSRRGGGVASFLLAHEVANLDAGVRNQAFHERGLPTSGSARLRRGDLAGATDFQHRIEFLRRSVQSRETTVEAAVHCIELGGQLGVDAKLSLV